MTGDQSEPKRELGYFETVTASSSRTVVSMVCVLQGEGQERGSSSEGGGGSRIQESALQHGIMRLAVRHPHLRSVLEKQSSSTCSGGTTLCLRLLPDYDFEKVPLRHLQVLDVPCDSDETWQRLVEHESNIGFDLDGHVPFWKVILIRGPSRDVLVIKYHHCIGDGFSGYRLIHDLLTFMNSSNQDNNENGEGEKIALPLLPSIDEMCFPHGRNNEDNAHVQQGVEKLRTKRQSWYPRLPFASDPPPGNRHSILYRDGTTENLQSLLVACRARKVTVGAVLGAATFFAVAKINGGQNPFPSRQNEPTNSMSKHEEPFYFDFDMDVNLRKRLPVSLGNDHVGAYIGMMTFKLPLTRQTRFWDFVATMRDAVLHGIDEKQHIHYLEVNRLLDEEEMSADSKAWKKDDGHAQDMNFSNLGPYPFSPEYDGGRVRIDKIYCVGSGWCPQFGGYVFLIPSVRALNYSLVYEKADVNDQTARTFFDHACNLTEQACSLPEDFTLEDYMAE